MFYMHGIGWAWWLLLAIGVIVFWGAVVLAVTSFMRLRDAERHSERHSEIPEEILKGRLAEGDLSVDEYERLHAALDAHAHDRATA
jgi:putative membrane protein